MDLVALYAGTPVERHGDIIISGGRVYVRGAEGTEEYVLLPDGELKLVRSDPSTSSGQALEAIRQDVERIKAKLGA